ncbi:hypothetical protein Tcan_18329 [Toxocara canis]|uniref:RING-type domain-containing protein n=1 Tax=Toxocara canis TaxID=6265 RepID=A0A0B2V7I1_TOXCA|nr:hypothetical protein Tcan_18329 [Toxocara canis]
MVEMPCRTLDDIKCPAKTDQIFVRQTNPIACFVLEKIAYVNLNRFGAALFCNTFDASNRNSGFVTSNFVPYQGLEIMCWVCGTSGTARTVFRVWICLQLTRNSHTHIPSLFHCAFDSFPKSNKFGQREMCSSSGRAVPLVPTDNENVVPLEKSDDLSSKYGIASDNVVCTKKRNKKLRSRPLGIEFPLHGNGLARPVCHVVFVFRVGSRSQLKLGLLFAAAIHQLCSFDSSHAFRNVTEEELSSIYCDEFPVVSSNTEEQKINDILPTMKNVFREFLHNIGSNVSNMDQLNEFLATIEISEFERKILNDLLKSGHLQQLVEQSGLFDICSDGDRITLSSKRDEGAAVLKKPNIFQNLLRTTGVAVDSLSTGIMDGCAMTLHDVARGSIYSTPGGSVLNGQVLSNTRPSSADANRSLIGSTTIAAPESRAPESRNPSKYINRDEGAAVLKKPNIFQNLLRTTGVAVDSLSTGIMDGCAMTLHDVARGSIYSTPGGSVLNGQVLSNTRPSSADANRALMNYTAWSGNSLAHDIVQSTVGCKDAFTERLRQQLEERCNELARIKEQSAVLMVQTSKVLAEKEAVEKRLLDMESKLSQRNDCLQRESEQARLSTERERNLERELGEIRAENAAYKGLLIAERSRLKKAYKELLELRLGKAKTLALRRIEQAKSGFAHADMLQKRCPVIEVKKDIEQVMKQWKQIGDDYEEWLSNLDKLAGAQKVLIDKDKDFDELPLLTPPNHIPGAPSLPTSLITWCNGSNAVTSDCTRNGMDAVVSNTRVPPPGFEGHTFRGGMYGAIGQRKVSSSNTFGEAHIKKQIMRRPSIPVESATSVAPWASARSECHRTVNMDSYECKICLNAIVSDERLLKCPNPGCNEPFHKECVIGWVKSDSTCPNCRGVWRDPMEFPTLSSTLP